MKTTAVEYVVQQVNSCGIFDIVIDVLQHAEAVRGPYV